MKFILLHKITSKNRTGYTYFGKKHHKGIDKTITMCYCYLYSIYNN